MVNDMNQDENIRIVGERELLEFMFQSIPNGKMVVPNGDQINVMSVTSKTPVGSFGLPPPNEIIIEATRWLADQALSEGAKAVFLMMFGSQMEALKKRFCGRCITIIHRGKKEEIKINE